MTNKFALNRRQALIASASLPLLATAAPALAAAPMQGTSSNTTNSFMLGGFEVTALLVGSRTVPEPHGIFGTNVSTEEFTATSKAYFLPADKAQFYFTPTLVNTGAELVLFDTGLNRDGIVGALATAGYTPDQIDVVVITHMHGDHVGGLSDDIDVTFPNARYVTARAEYDGWNAMPADKAGAFQGKVAPLAEKMTFLEDGGSVVSGITAMAAFGHTPGHMTYMLESNGEMLLLAADTANHFVYSLGFPDWEVRFDMDKAAAAATRRKVFGMLAADKIPFIGYHMPFPAMGYVEAKDSGFRYVPATYQMIV